MNHDLHRDVLKRLLDEFKFKENGDWLQEGVCTQCGKKELYANAASPWVVRCGRRNKCGWEAYVKDLYEDLFESWSDRHEATVENPNASADAYLIHARGFDLARLAGSYMQGWFRDSESKATSATVRFPLACGGYWERLIDRPHRFGKRKANFSPCARSSRRVGDGGPVLHQLSAHFLEPATRDMRRSTAHPGVGARWGSCRTRGDPAVGDSGAQGRLDLQGGDD